MHVKAKSNRLQWVKSRLIHVGVKMIAYMFIQVLHWSHRASCMYLFFLLMSRQPGFGYE